MLDWRKVNKYSIESGQYRVTKFYVQDEAVFLVFHVKQIIGRFTDSIEARECASKHSAEVYGTEHKPKKEKTNRAEIEATAMRELDNMRRLLL